MNKEQISGTDSRNDGSFLERLNDYVGDYPESIWDDGSAPIMNSLDLFMVSRCKSDPV